MSLLGWKKQFEQKHQEAWAQEKFFTKVSSLGKREKIMSLLGFKDWNNWAQEEILAKVSRLEKFYWTWSVIGGVTGIVIGFVLASFSGSLYPGMVAVFLIMMAIKFVCSESLYTLHVIWEIRKREEDAVLTSEIQDL